MALKNLFDMVKADRYTADGREELIKAQEAETEDRVYQNGEISQKTGLMKTPNGWVEPKKGAKRINALEGGKKGMVTGEPRNTPQPKPKLTEQNYNEQKEVLKKFENVPEEKKNNNPYYVHAVDVVKQWEEQKDTESKPDAADQRDQIGSEIKENLGAAKYYFQKAQSFSPTDPSYKTYMKKAKQYNDEAKAQADDYGFEWEEMHNSRITHALNTYSGDSAPRILTGDTKIRVRKA